MERLSMVNPPLFLEHALNFLQNFQTVPINSIFFVGRNAGAVL